MAAVSIRQMMLILLLLLLAQLSAAKLQSQWTSSLGLEIVVTCTGEDPTPCPIGFGCNDQGVCSPTTTNVSTCFTCNYSGGAQPQCAVKCPPNTRLSASCGVWSAPPNTTPCRRLMGSSANDACMKAELQTCDQEPLRCIEIPCSAATTVLYHASRFNCPSETLINPVGDFTCPEKCGCVLNYTSSGKIAHGVQIKVEVGATAEINLVSRAGSVQRQAWTIQSAGSTNVHCLSDGSCDWFRFLGEGLSVGCEGEFSCLGATCEGASSSIVSCGGWSDLRHSNKCGGAKGCGNWTISEELQE